MDALRARMNHFAANPPGGGRIAVMPDEVAVGPPGHKMKKIAAEASPRPREISPPPATRPLKESSSVLVDDFLQGQTTFRSRNHKDMSYEEEKAWHMQRLGEMFAFHCDTREKLEKNCSARITSLKKERNDLKDELVQVKSDLDVTKTKVDCLRQEMKNEAAKYKEKIAEAAATGKNLLAELDKAALFGLKCAEDGYELFRKNLRDLPPGGDWQSLKFVWSGDASVIPPTLDGMPPTPVPAPPLSVSPVSPGLVSELEGGDETS